MRETGIIFMLCLCIVMQLLGAPITLLDPTESPDTLASSVLEGFSVPPTLFQLGLSSESVLIGPALPMVHVPVLESVLFHPPLS